MISLAICWYLRRVEQSGQRNSRLNVLLSLGLWLLFLRKFVFLSLAPAWRDAFASINSWKTHSNSIVLWWKDIDLKPYGHEWARQVQILIFKALPLMWDLKCLGGCSCVCWICVDISVIFVDNCCYSVLFVNSCWYVMVFR